MANPANPPVKNTAFTFYVTLSDPNDEGDVVVNPTIAAGDFKVSIDDGSLNNLATLPSVSPASSAWVKIALSSSEMNGDNIKIQCIDQTSPREWNTLMINLVTTANDITSIKTQTDKFVFTVANQVDANIQYVNDVEVTGDGQSGTEWGPA
jgi:hypothetical protein